MNVAEPAPTFARELRSLRQLVGVMERGALVWQESARAWRGYRAATVGCTAVALAAWAVWLCRANDVRGPVNALLLLAVAAVFVARVVDSALTMTVQRANAADVALSRLRKRVQDAYWEMTQ